MWKLVHIVSRWYWFQIHTYIFEIPTQKSIFGPIEESLDFWNSKPKIRFRANLGPKSETCLFFVKIGPHTISRVVVLKPDLDFWNCDHKTPFRANLSTKVQNCLFSLKIGAPSIWRMLIPIIDVQFENSNSKIHFWANLRQKTQSCLFSTKISGHK